MVILLDHIEEIIIQVDKQKNNQKKNNKKIRKK